MSGAVVSQGEESDAVLLDSALLATLRSAQPQAINEGVVLTLRDGAFLLGGLCGKTSYGWLHIDVLWIDPDHRGMGHGRKLMNAARDAARAHRCHGMWLDTSSRDARDFYLSLGFSTFGRLANRPDQTPHEHRRWFLSAPIDDEGD